MVFKYKVGTFVSNTGTGNQIISDVGFRPDSIILMMVGVSNESANVDLQPSNGMYDGINQKGGCYFSEDGVASQHRFQDQDGMLCQMNMTSNGIEYSVVGVSLNSDGFTVNIAVNTNSTAFLIRYIAFGGLENVIVGQSTVNNSPVNTLAFQPNLLICFSTGQAPGDGTNSDHGIYNIIGCANATDEWWLADYVGNNNATPKDSLIRNTGFCGQYFNNSITWEMTLTSFDTNGFTWGGSDADAFFYMAIELPAGVDTHITTVQKDVAAAPDTQTLPNSTFTPVGYILASAGNTSQTDLTAGGSNCSVGAFDDLGNAWNISWFAPDNATNQADQRSDNEEVLKELTTAAADLSSATPQSISDSTPDVIWDPNSSNAIWLGYLAFEFQQGYELVGVTQDRNLIAVSSCRIVCFKQDNAAQASRLFTIQAHGNSDGGGDYTIGGLSDNDSQYMIYSIKLDTPQIRGLTDDDLQPVIE